MKKQQQQQQKKTNPIPLYFKSQADKQIKSITANSNARPSGIY